MPIPVDAPFKALVCGSSFGGIVGSNPVGGMDVCLLWVLCVDRLGVSVGLITCPEGAYWLWYVWVWSWSLDNEEAMAHKGLSRHGKKGI